MHRRGFLGHMAAGIGGGFLAGNLGSIAYGTPLGARNASGAYLKNAGPTFNSAKNLVFVLLEGGASHVDTFDLKMGRETPDSLGSMDLGGYLWPAGIMPKLAAMPEKFSLVRSLTAVEAVHERAVYHLTTAYQHDASRSNEIPHFLSAMAYLLAEERRGSDSLPTFIQFGPALAQNGFFPTENRALELSGDAQIPYLRHDFPDAEPRFQALNRLLETAQHLSDARGERIRVQNQAQRLMADDELQALLGTPEENEDAEMEYGESGLFKRQAEAVTRVLNADKGSRVIQMFLGGWDHHDRIYAAGPGGLPDLARTLDEGLAALITGLDAQPAKQGPGTLLDETLIVVAGEFGRTTRGLNQSRGRDHYPYVMSALFAGGGVKGGRVIGSSDSTGSNIRDPGWSHTRYMSIPDLVATLYSALGIDWTRRFTDTPSGRLFELVPTDRVGQVFHIDGLFG